MTKKIYIAPEIDLVVFLEGDVMANSSLIFPIRPLSLDHGEELEY